MLAQRGTVDGSRRDGRAWCGKKLGCKVTEDGDKIKVVLKSGMNVTVDRRDVDKIVYTKDDPAPGQPPPKQPAPT